MSSAIASSALSRPDGSAMLQGGAEHESDDSPFRRHRTFCSSPEPRWDDARQGYALLCDPAIANGFRLPWFQPLDLWTYWEAIKVPVLVLRGVHSDLLSFDLAAEMRKRNRFASLFQFDDCGHVPPLMAPEQIEVVTRFLLDDTRPGLGER